MNRPRILIVDDSPVVALLLSNLLEEKLDAICTTYHSIDDFNTAEIEAADLCIVDYLLEASQKQDMYNGDMALKQIKAIKPDVPVIVFSGQNDISVALDLISLGAIDYVDKNHHDFIEQIIESAHNVLYHSTNSEKVQGLKNEIKQDRTQLILLCIGISIIGGICSFMV